MSLTATQRAWKASGISPTERLVLLDLADRANREDFAWPSIEDIMDRTGLGKTAVYTALRVLKACKLVNQEWIPGRRDVPAFVVSDTELESEYSPDGFRQTADGFRETASEQEIPPRGKSCSPNGMPNRYESPKNPPLNPPEDPLADFDHDLPGIAETTNSTGLTKWAPVGKNGHLAQALAELFKRAPELKPRRAFAGSRLGPMLGTGLSQKLESKLGHAWGELERAQPPASWDDFLLLANWFNAGQMQWATDPLSWIISNLSEAVDRAAEWKAQGSPVGIVEKDKKKPAHSDNSMVHPDDLKRMRGGK